MASDQNPYPAPQNSLKKGFSADILLIEDNYSYAELVKIFLLGNNQAFTCEVTVGYSLEEGLSFLRQKEFDAILLDLNLPDSKGLQTLNRLLNAFPNSNVIVLTGSADKEQGVQAVVSGAQDYLIKNEFESHYLARVLRFSIERRQILSRLEEAQKIAKIGHWECRPESNYFFASNQLYQLFGLNPNDKILSYEEILDTSCVFHPLSFPLRPLQFGQQNAGTLEHTIKNTAGADLHFLLNYQIEKNTAGALVLLGTIQDITLQKQAEELRRSRDLAIETSRIREQVVANVSHELRTPMNAILGMSNLLVDMPMEAQQQEYVEAIQDASNVLLGVINDILLASSLQNGNLPLHPVSFDLKSMIRRLTDILKPKVEDKALKITCEFDQQLTANSSKFIGDKQRLSQIIFNLVGNAIKFTEQGSITLSVSQEEQKNAQELLIKFVIKDTGIGIPQEKQTEIFDAFTRVHNSSQSVEGTGLGLSIAKQLIERMGGYLSLESELGVGTEFSFVLPFKIDIQAKIPFADTKEPFAKEQVSGLNSILVVEDHRMNQLVIQKTLKKKWPDLNILVANCGEEAIKILSDHSVDIILMDIQMPGLDGYETTTHIRDTLNQTAEKLPIIAMTAHSQVKSNAQYLACGMNNYILKPFEPNELFKKISQYFLTDAGD